eukprot:720801-Lingulodinium_polyedra.AAC.1
MASLHPGDLDLAMVPLQQDTALSLRAKRMGKAAGEDGIPPEAVKAAAGQFAAALIGLNLKAALRIEEPLMWRGSFIQE